MMTGYFCCEVMFPQDEFLSVRLVAKSPYAKGRFFRFWILPLSREFCYSPGDGVTISALFFSCGYSSAPSSRLELVAPSLGLLRKDFWQTV